MCIRDRGNSGGALVNAKGELVGINAMLYSPTGAYSGYGFAIPTRIMTKVVADLKQFGTCLLYTSTKVCLTTVFALQ